MTLTSREVRFSLPSLEVAGKVWGEPGGIPVIGLHGWLDNAATFDHIAPALKGVQLVALDLPGHGLSDHLPMAGRPGLGALCSARSLDGSNYQWHPYRQLA